MARGKAEDAGGLTPAKDDNAALCHFGRRTLPIFKCVDYKKKRRKPCIPLETLVELSYEQEVFNMAGKLMRIKKIVVPFMTLVIVLAGCAAMSSDETFQSMQESPDAAQVIGADGQQIVTDAPDNSGVGAADSNEDQIAELTHEDLNSTIHGTIIQKSSMAAAKSHLQSVKAVG